MLVSKLSENLIYHKVKKSVLLRILFYMVIKAGIVFHYYMAIFLTWSLMWKFLPQKVSVRDTVILCTCFQIGHFQTTDMKTYAICTKHNVSVIPPSNLGGKLLLASWFLHNEDLLDAKNLDFHIGNTRINLLSFTSLVLILQTFLSKFTIQCKSVLKHPPHTSPLSSNTYKPYLNTGHQ